MKQEEKQCRILQKKMEDLMEKHYQKKIYKLYMFAWNVIFSSPNAPVFKWTIEELQSKLQKSKTGFLSYLSFHDWNRREEDVYINQRLIQTIAIYIVYDGSLHPLEKLHLAKHYCQNIDEPFDLLDKKALTEIVKQPYLQNSLYESGKSSYIKK